METKVNPNECWEFLEEAFHSEDQDSADVICIYTGVHLDPEYLAVGVRVAK